MLASTRAVVEAQETLILWFLGTGEL